MSRTYSQQTLEALRTLGLQVAIARRERRWSLSELSERAGIAPNTLRAVEQGTPTVAVGLAFEVAALLGVPLFGAEDTTSLRAVNDAAAGRLALLPTRIRESGERDNDF